MTLVIPRKFFWGSTLLLAICFGIGLPDGVPSNVKVAHKIGESLETYSDCGIVYYPGRPYSLCLMIKLPPQAEPVIRDLSRLTYAEAANAIKLAAR
jgi:hypothetical protein